MALITYSECSKEISDKAEMSPSCGSPTSIKQKGKENEKI